MLRALSEPKGTGDRLPDNVTCPACGGDEIGILSFGSRPVLSAEEGQRIQHTDCGSVFEICADGLRVLPADEAAATLEGNW